MPKLTSNVTSTLITPSPQPLPPPRKAADVLVEALEREEVSHVFAYPGGASLEIHRALTRSKSIRTILPRHEQGGILAADGYARASGRPGVVIATSGPGATNLVTGLADAMADSVPVVAITGQVARKNMGTNAFQEAPTVDITRSITKRTFLLLDPNDIPRVLKEAFLIVQSGRPGPVLIDIPKDVQEEVIAPKWTNLIQLPEYDVQLQLPSPPDAKILDKIVDMIFEAERPVLYVGGGCVNASEELRRFVELTHIPVASTLMGLGVFPCNDVDGHFLGMLGMHGTICANFAVNHSDLLLAFGVRFDDRVTGKIEAFASQARIVHIDIDPSEIGKNKQPYVSMHCDIKLALKAINNTLFKSRLLRSINFFKWRNEIGEQKLKHPLVHQKKHVDHNNKELIHPEDTILVLNELTKGSAIITTGVGQHQMFAARCYEFKSARQLVTSGGMGTMGFGLPAAIGAAVAKPGNLVIDLDGDGSFMMNVQELATVRAENLPIKIVVLNNQHLGMVVQPEDIFYKEHQAYTYLGNPDTVKFAEACDIPGERVRKRSQLRGAIQRMLETPGPYLLDIVVPNQVHLLPMIPIPNWWNV